MSKHQVLRLARTLDQAFRPVEICELDDDYHAFIVRYSGEYTTHAHERDEFIYIMEGAVNFEMGGDEVEVRQGEAILIPAGRNHRPRCPNFALGLVVEAKGLQTGDERS
ncbi:MAG: cupin domain-containing protein [Candidatus Krumholzibacteriia bacterium]